MNTNRQRFIDAYSNELAKAIQANPGKYMNTVDEAELLATKMTDGLIAGRANLSDVARKACRKLGISPTYKGVEAFLKPSD